MPAHRTERAAAEQKQPAVPGGLRRHHACRHGKGHEQRKLQNRRQRLKCHRPVIAFRLPFPVQPVSKNPRRCRAQDQKPHLHPELPAQPPFSRKAHQIPVLVPDPAQQVQRPCKGRQPRKLHHPLRIRRAVAVVKQRFQMIVQRPQRRLIGKQHRAAKQRRQHVPRQHYRHKRHMIDCQKRQHMKRPRRHRLRRGIAAHHAKACPDRPAQNKPRKADARIPQNAVSPDHHIALDRRNRHAHVKIHFLTAVQPAKALHRKQHPEKEGRQRPHCRKPDVRHKCRPQPFSHFRRRQRRQAGAVRNPR